VSVDALQVAAEEYLAACIDALDTLTSAGAPARTFVSPGAPAWDCCPMLCVHVGDSTVAATRLDGGTLAAGHRIVLTGIVDQPYLTATVLRCEPDAIGKAVAAGQPPPTAALTGFAATLNEDIWAIRNWVRARKADGTLFSGVCRELTMEPGRSLTVAGLCGGWEQPIRITLDGYEV
jgi:hypothetical protein